MNLTLNRNRAIVMNGVDANADTGNNDANGSKGGSGGGTPASSVIIDAGKVPIVLLYLLKPNQD